MCHSCVGAFNLYVTHYNLSEDPFRFSPDEYEAYRYRSYSSAIAFLQHVIGDDLAVLILVSGVTGVGKSTLINDLFQQQDISNFLFAKLHASQINNDGLIFSLSHAFELDAAKNEQASIQQLQEYLEWSTKNLSIQIVIDDAHDLSPDNLFKLGQLVRLINENKYNTKILLSGNQAINQLLNTASVHGIQKDVIVGWDLDGMNESEIAPYVAHRLGNVGGQDAVSFKDDIWKSLYRFTGGIPRRINRICNRLLINGLFENKSEFNNEDVMQVIQQLDDEGLLEISHKFAVIHGLVGSNTDEDEDDNDFDMSAFYVGFKELIGSEPTEEPPLLELAEEFPLFAQAEDATKFVHTEEPPLLEQADELPQFAQAEDATKFVHTEEPPLFEQADELPLFAQAEDATKFVRTEEPPLLEQADELPLFTQAEDATKFVQTEEPPLFVLAEDSPDDIDYPPLSINKAEDTIDYNLDDYETQSENNNSDEIVPIKSDHDSIISDDEIQEKGWQWNGTFILMLLGVIAFAAMTIYSGMDSPLFSNDDSEKNKTDITTEKDSSIVTPDSTLAVKNEFETDMMEVENDIDEQPSINESIDTDNSQSTPAISKPEVVAIPESTPAISKPEVVATPESTPAISKPEVVATPESTPAISKPEVVATPESTPAISKPEVVATPESTPAISKPEVVATPESTPAISKPEVVATSIKNNAAAESNAIPSPGNETTKSFTGAQYKFMLQSGFWNKGNSPAILLPSELNSCSDSGSDIFCLAKERKKQSENALITYQTGAMIQNFSDDGTFTVLYRSNITEKKEIPTPTSLAVSSRSLPTDLKEREMQCRFVKSSIISCIENGVISDYKRRFISNPQ